MQPVSATRRYRRLIGSVLVTALVLASALRLAGLGFGRGVLIARPDEELLRSGVLIALTGDLNPHYAVWGHLFHYIYSAVAAAWVGGQVAFGRYSTWTEAVAAAHCEPWMLIGLGRAISAAAGILTVAATYQLARRSLGSRLVAICACVLLSTMFLHVRDSHFATSDVMLALFSTTALAAMVHRRRFRPGWAGIWTGLALATKLFSVTVVLSCLSLAVLARRQGDERSLVRARSLPFLQYLTIATLVALVSQPFLILDPMETWFGLFGDLFNPERHPFERGLSLTNASIIARYYVPQAMGSLMGFFALFGGLHLLVRMRSPRLIPLLAFCFWSVAAILSVQRIFLRYVDAMLPAACVLAAHGIDWIARSVTSRRRRSAAARLVLTGCVVALLALPNLWRAAWLDSRLMQPDTRELAAGWIERNVPAGDRVLWSGYGAIPPEVTMPWLHAPVGHDRAHIALRKIRGLPTAVDEAIIDWKVAHNVPTFSLVGLGFGERHEELLGFDAYPFLEHHYEIGWLRWLDEWSRRRGLLRRESPRMDLMRRHVVQLLVTAPENLLEREEQFLVLTGMPCHPELVARIPDQFKEVQRFEPGVRWNEFAGQVMYDLGDRWYLPNWGLDRVVQPGPEIRIFRRHPAQMENAPSAPQTSDERKHGAQSD